MTPQEALDRIAALCDGFQADGHGDAVSITSVRAVLAEVTPEPGDMPSPILALVRPVADCEDAIAAAYQRGVEVGRESA